MQRLTFLILFISTNTFYLQRKFSKFKEVFSFALFSLFFGFLVGNLFGTFLNLIRPFIFWDGFIIFIIVFSMEFLDCVLYNRFFKPNNPSLVAPFPYKEGFFITNQQSWKIINILKIGVKFGFFIDAFKVGS